MEEEPKLKESQKWLMLGVAIAVDATSALVNLIPIVGQIASFFVGLFFTMTFWLWFKMNGMNFSKPKNILGLAGGSIIEMIPVLNALPAWTATVLYLTRVEKIIDKTVAQVPGASKISNVVSISQGKKPENSGDDNRKAA